MPSANGIIAKLNKTVAITIAGARIKTYLSANAGIQSSLKNILIISARTWNKPKGPTLLGPYLSCQRLNILLSTHISKAAMFNITKRTPAIINNILNVSFIFYKSLSYFTDFNKFNELNHRYILQNGKTNNTIR